MGKPGQRITDLLPTGEDPQVETDDFDDYGEAVALDNGVAVIGAYGRESSGSSVSNQVGKLYIFEEDDAGNLELCAGN